MTATPSPLHRVREAARWVAAEGEHVRITRKLPEYSQALVGDAGGSMPEVEWDDATHFRGGAVDTAAFVLTLDAINFGSGYFPHLLKSPGMSGYFTVASSLTERFMRQGPFSAGELSRVTVANVMELLHQEPGDPVREELMTLYTKALNQLGDFLERNFAGSALAAVRAARGSAVALVGILMAMPLFRDVSRYRGRPVPLLKRAQITASDLALARPDDPDFAFRDLADLTIFADNLVPHVLRIDGVLEYSPELVARLDRGELLAAGSDEEVEIRAVSIHAVEEMRHVLRESGRHVTSRTLDLLLWNRGQAALYRGGSKHRTRTTNY